MRIYYFQELCTATLLRQVSSVSHFTDYETGIERRMNLPMVTASKHQNENLNLAGLVRGLVLGYCTGKGHCRSLWGCPGQALSGIHPRERGKLGSEGGGGWDLSQYLHRRPMVATRLVLLSEKAELFHPLSAMSQKPRVDKSVSDFLKNDWINIRRKKPT